MGSKIVKLWNLPIFLYPQARGGSLGGRYRRKYRDGEVDDFLPKFYVCLVVRGIGWVFIVFIYYLLFRGT